MPRGSVVAVSGWVGSSILAVLAIGLGAAVLWQDWSWQIKAALIVVTLAAIVLKAPFLRREVRKVQPVSESKFIKGPVIGSEVSDIDSDADTFIDGYVQESVITRIIHRARGNRDDAKDD